MNAQQRWAAIGWTTALLLGGALAVSVRQPNSAPAPTERRQEPEVLSDGGRPAPEFRLRSFAGRTISLSEFRGDLIVLNFWASWCVPCREEMPTLERAWQEFGNRAVVIVGINVADDYDAARDFLKQVGVTYPNVYDPEQTRLEAYQVTALPTTVLIDPKMRIRGRVAGGYIREAGYQTLRKHVLSLLDTSP
jgi:peroxiredoxin